MFLFYRQTGLVGYAVEIYGILICCLSSETCCPISKGFVKDTHFIWSIFIGHSLSFFTWIFQFRKSRRTMHIYGIIKNVRMEKVSGCVYFEVRVCEHKMLFIHIAWRRSEMYHTVDVTNSLLHTRSTKTIFRIPFFWARRDTPFRLHFSNQLSPFHLTVFHILDPISVWEWNFGCDGMHLATVYCSPDYFRIIKQWWCEIIINIHTTSGMSNTRSSANCSCNDSALLSHHNETFWYSQLLGVYRF